MVRRVLPAVGVGVGVGLLLLLLFSLIGVRDQFPLTMFGALIAAVLTFFGRSFQVKRADQHEKNQGRPPRS